MRRGEPSVVRLALRLLSGAVGQVELRIDRIIGAPLGAQAIHAATSWIEAGVREADYLPYDSRTPAAQASALLASGVTVAATGAHTMTANCANGGYLAFQDAKLITERRET